MNLTAIIIDDNKSSIKLLSKLLEEFFPQVELLGSCTSVQEGSTKISELAPDIVFLDVEMPGEDGFELFKYHPDHDFETIFITAFSEYAAEAFRVGSVDYLVKPLDPDELKIAITRVEDKLTPLSINGISKDARIAISTKNGTEFLFLDSIRYCEADDNYTTICYEEESALVSKPLKSFQKTLEPLGFFRASRSHLINTSYIKSISNGKKPQVRLTDGKSIPLVLARKKDLMAIMLNKTK